MYLTLTVENTGTQLKLLSSCEIRAIMSSHSDLKTFWYTVAGTLGLGATAAGVILLGRKLLSTKLGAEVMCVHQ